MRYVFFDLGNTLEIEDVLRPGAREAIVAIAALRDDLGVSPRLGLISDFDEPETPADIPALEEDYRRILVKLGIDDLFQPFAQAITLSSQVGVFKPDRRIFRAALDKFDPDAHFHDAIFVTENVAHIAAARELGMHALHLKGPGQTSADVDSLPELVEPIARLLRFSPCCKKSGEAVGYFKSAASKSTAKNDAIANAVADVDAVRLKAQIDALTAFPTRWSMSSGIASVSQHVRDAFVAAGYTGANEVRFQKFTMSGAPQQRNVLCGPAAFTRPVILVCAHYDSTSDTPSTKAPGGDDNASGTAALLELARLLRGVTLKRDILFAAFGGEEQGLFGSQHCADVAAAEGWPIELVINMDMIGFPNGTPANRIVVEFDQGNRNPQNDASSKAFGLLMAQAAVDYTSLAVEHTDIWNSDYMPFEAKGLACIGAYEGGENPFYHKATDAASTVKMPYLQDVVRMVLATILTIAR